MDAEYFSPRYQAAMATLGKQGRSIGDIANLAQRRFQPEVFKGQGIFQYIEIGSLQSDGVAGAEPTEVSEAPSRAQWIVEPNDVITSTVRPIRRLSAVISAEQAGYVCSSGFAVLEPKRGASGIEPEVLLTFLRLPIVCEILDLHTTASMYPAISTTRLMTIPIPIPNQSIRDKVVSRVRAAFSARADAARLLDESKLAIERIVLKGVK
jgi:restriction endonuclease S subunit